MECINCNRGPRAQDLYHALDMAPDVISVIEKWRNNEVHDGDALCAECLHLIHVELDRCNMPVSNNSSLSTDHCICCNISISRRSGRRSRLIPVGMPERAYIAELILPRHIPTDARVCNRCWQHAHGSSQRDQQLEPVLAAEPELALVVEREQVQIDEQIPVQNEVHERSYINLNNFVRTPNTANHCFVPDCSNEERLRVPNYIRRKLLKERKLLEAEFARCIVEHTIGTS